MIYVCASCGHMDRVHESNGCTWGGCDCHKLVANISPAEQAVIIAISRGLCTKDIARLQCVSAKTIDCHRFHVYAKLRVHSVSELIIFSLKRGIVRLDELPDPSPDIAVGLLASLGKTA